MSEQEQIIEILLFMGADPKTVLIFTLSLWILSNLMSLFSTMRFLSQQSKKGDAIEMAKQAHNKNIMKLLTSDSQQFKKLKTPNECKAIVEKFHRFLDERVEKDKNKYTDSLESELMDSAYVLAAIRQGKDKIIKKWLSKVKEESLSFRSHKESNILKNSQHRQWQQQ